MAITKQERVGKAMDLLRVGLAPFVEREFNNLHQALAYNGLVQSWPEIARLAREGGDSASQPTLFQ